MCFSHPFLPILKRKFNRWNWGHRKQSLSNEMKSIQLSNSCIINCFCSFFLFFFKSMNRSLQSGAGHDSVVQSPAASTPGKVWSVTYKLLPTTHKGPTPELPSWELISSFGLEDWRSLETEKNLQRNLNQFEVYFYLSLPYANSLSKLFFLLGNGWFPCGRFIWQPAGLCTAKSFSRLKATEGQCTHKPSPHHFHLRIESQGA